MLDGALIVAVCGGAVTIGTKIGTAGLPEAIKRIQTAVGREVAVNFDLVTMLGSCTTQADRLPAARTVVTRTKMTAKAAVAAKSGFASIVRSATAMANKAQDKPPPDAVKKEEEPFNSPNALIPLVEAIEFVCSRHPSVTQAIAAAISTVHFAMIPGAALVASLALHQAVDSPVVAPSRAGVPPIKDGVLVYTGCFEAGSKGCHTKQYIIDVFEEHFRCREKGYVRRPRIVSDHFLPQFSAPSLSPDKIDPWHAQLLSPLLLGADWWLRSVPDFIYFLMHFFRFTS